MLGIAITVAAVLLVPGGAAQARSLDEVFHTIPTNPPRDIAMICVKYGADGHPIGALVDGRNDDPALNAQMLALLLSYKSAPTTMPLGLQNTWIAEAVERSGKPAGAPVPEDPFRCPTDNETGP
jgi:hypothetical protein